MYRKNFRNYIIVVVILLLCFISMGYALIASKLDINGDASVQSVNWNIYYDNVVVKSGSVEATKPSIVDETTVEYSVNFTKPGDFYEFTVDVVNAGGIDAVLESLTETGLTAAQKKYLAYSVNYDDEEKTQIKSGDKLPSGETKTVVVHLEFMKNIDAADLPTENQTIDLSFGTKYVQDGSAIVTPPQEDDPVNPNPGEPVEEEKGEDYISNTLILGSSWVSNTTNKTVALTVSGATNRCTVEEPLHMSTGDAFVVSQTSDYVFGYFFATKDDNGIYHYDKDYGWQTALASRDVRIVAPSDDIYIITNWKKSNNGTMTETDLDNIKLLISFEAAD